MQPALVPVAVFAFALSLPGPLRDPARQHHQGMVMGFDQDATTHHFYLYDDGGAIDVSVKDASDRENLAGIRRHLEMLPVHFGAGDFSMPEAVHEGTPVTGIEELARLKDEIAYRYSATPLGARVDIVTADPEALAAVHAYLRFQIRDHETGDSTEVTVRR